MVDLDAVIGECMGAFGESALVRYADGTPSVTISGVYDEAFTEVTLLGAGPFAQTERLNLGAPGGITAQVPVLGVQLSQFDALLSPYPDQGDFVTILRTGEAFQVREQQPDGHGWAKLMLSGIG